MACVCVWQDIVDSNDRDLNRTARRRPRASDGGMHSMWKHFDNNWMKPIFGGSPEESLFFGVEDDDDDEIQELIADRRIGARANSSNGNGFVGIEGGDGQERGGVRGGPIEMRRDIRRPIAVAAPPPPSRGPLKYTPPLRDDGGL